MQAERISEKQFSQRRSAMGLTLQSQQQRKVCSMRRLINKRFAVVLGVVAALVAASAAYAYFTSTGSGSGTATVGSSTPVVISSTTTGELFPGAEAPLTIKVLNKGKGSEYVGTVSLKEITTAEAGCKPEWFSFASVAVNKTLAAGEEVTVTGAVKMANVNESQNACQGATVTVHYQSN
jgi:hypothetical protein